MGTAASVATPPAASLPDLTAASPALAEFFKETKTYSRIHVHLIGARKAPENGETATKKSKGGFGLGWLSAAVDRDKTPDPYCVVTAVGENTGSLPSFDVGRQKFPTLIDCKLPVWDMKGMLIAKTAGTSGVQLQVFDQNSGDDSVLMDITVSQAELPDPSAGWVEFVKKSDGATTSDAMAAMELVFRLKVTPGDERIGSAEAAAACFAGNDDLVYSEQEMTHATAVPDAAPYRSLLMKWTHKTPSKKVALWFLGRNDCFMHTHVAKALFFDAGIDLFVLNYHENGKCRRNGWVTDSHLVSHINSSGMAEFHEEIKEALEATKGYEEVLGYAHSTGAPVLLDYLMEHGDDAFDGFVLNSPFLDWGKVGGEIVEHVLENLPTFMLQMGVWDHDKKMGAKSTPAEYAAPLSYLGQEVMMSSWAGKLWSLYHFDSECRPLYKVPMTAGFASAVTKCHTRMKEEFADKKRYITTKPFLVVSSRGDDVLTSSETFAKADIIGPSRTEVDLQHNGHDIFLSQDADDTTMAIDCVKVWLKHQGWGGA